MKKRFLSIILGLTLLASVAIAGIQITGGKSILDIGSAGIQIYNTVVLYFRQSGILDIVSGNSQTDTSAGAAYYIHPTTGALVTVAATEVLNHPTLGNVSFGSYEQLCQDSEDPGEWVLFGATYADTGETFGPFTEGTVTDSANVTHRAVFWQSSVSGSPSGTLYFNIRYRAGTSGNIYLSCGDSTPTLYSIYSGVIGSASISTFGSGSAGTLTIISDEYDATLGYYILKGSMLFTNLGNTITIGIGPNSTTNKNIKVLGADVSESRTILDFHCPSGPATGNVTIASRAGTTRLPTLSTSFPKFYDALDGVADGVELVGTISDGYIAVDSTSEVLSGIGSGLSTTNWMAVTASTRYRLVYTNTGANRRMRIQFKTALDVITYSVQSSESPEEIVNILTDADTAYMRIYYSSASNSEPFSVKQISPAAARHSFTWTPGIDYTSWTAVKSILTPSDADYFLRASAAGGFELDDGTNTLRWPPTTGSDIPRTWTIGSGTPTINGDVIDFINESSDVIDTGYWTIGKSYRVNVTVSSYSGTGDIRLPYGGTTVIYLAAANGTYEYDYTPSDTYLKIYSFAGHTATVTVNSIYELEPYQFAAGTSYPMEIIYGYCDADSAYKQQLNVKVGSTWVSVKGDYDQSYNPSTDFIYGLSNLYQNAVKNYRVEKLKQSHWR